MSYESEKTWFYKLWCFYGVTGTFFVNEWLESHSRVNIAKFPSPSRVRVIKKVWLELTRTGPSLIKFQENSFCPKWDTFTATSNGYAFFIRKQLKMSLTSTFWPIKIALNKSNGDFRNQRKKLHQTDINLSRKTRSWRLYPPHFYFIQVYFCSK
jgi:hypothetical protein